MFCESVLWRMRFCPEPEPPRVPTSDTEPQCGGGPRTEAVASERSSRPRSAREVPGGDMRRDGHGNVPIESPAGIPGPSRRTTPKVDVPWPSKPSGDTFLVPSSCKSICKNYSDLLIGGDQVLPLSASGGQGGEDGDGSPRLPDGPFLQSSEIPPPLDSLPPDPRRDSPPRRTPARGDSSSRWRNGSGKERRPLSNSQLNAYLEQKLADLYRQHMAQCLARHGSPSATLASELVLLASVDQISQQLCRRQNLEVAKAKDMVISCLLRVASGLPSSSGEISTPQLQISED